jgi:hypothetical protein
MTTDAKLYHAGVSPLDTKNPSEHDAGMIPIAEFLGSPKQIGHEVCGVNHDDSRVLYTLMLGDCPMPSPGHWLLKDGTFIPAD